MLSMKIMTYLFERPKLLDFAGFMARKVVPKLPNFLIYNKFNVWGKTRDIPEFPEHSFKELYEKMKKEEREENDK